jgi:hypothetical protein
MTEALLALSTPCFIKRRGPELGLHLNPAKCEWSWLDRIARNHAPSVSKERVSVIRSNSFRTLRSRCWVCL